MEREAMWRAIGAAERMRGGLGAGRARSGYRHVINTVVADQQWMTGCLSVCTGRGGKGEGLATSGVCGPQLAIVEGRCLKVLWCSSGRVMSIGVLVSCADIPYLPAREAASARYVLCFCHNVAGLPVAAPLAEGLGTVPDCTHEKKKKKSTHRARCGKHEN